MGLDLRIKTNMASTTKQRNIGRVEIPNIPIPVMTNLSRTPTNTTPTIDREKLPGTRPPRLNTRIH